MKIKLSYFVFFYILTSLSIRAHAQTLTDYINEASKNYSFSSNTATNINQNTTTQLKFGYFINPQYTISGAQRAYVELNQDIPWIGKGNISRKWYRESRKRTQLLKQQELELLHFQIKEHYYKMYQFQKQKEIYAAWAEDLRVFIASSKKNTNIESNNVLKHYENQTKLIEVTQKFQITDGLYQNEVIIFNELLRSESLDEPRLPFLLAMPEEEIEFQFPDPYESSSFLNYENDILQQKYYNASQNPWTPKISLGLRYTDVTPTNTINFRLPTKNLIEPQLKIQWNLFSKKNPKTNYKTTNHLLDQKISSLSHQLQIVINNQISARIAYDSTVEQIEKIKTLEKQLKNINGEIDNEKKLQINSLKYTFEIQQIKAVSDYYISTSKMQLYF